MNRSKSLLPGLGVALVTPFNEHGAVDYPALQKIVEGQIEGGTDFLVVLGTTAETPTLLPEERRRIVDFVLEVNASRLPVVVGVTGNATAVLCEEISNWDCTGVAAFLVASPSYNKPSQEGIIAHYRAVADVADRPIILYNVPSRTGSNMTASTTLELAKHPNILGIKEASGDLNQIGEILSRRPMDFDVWSGDDALGMPAIALGADGLISVIGNLLPAMVSSMVHQAAFGQIHDARSTHSSLSSLVSLLFEEGNPAGVKAAMHHLNMCPPHVRLPLMEASRDLSERLYAAIAALDVPTH